MGRLIYGSITSLDGYIADERGNFDWAEPDEEVHQFVNDQERDIGTYLYGRRLYETMAVWDDDDWLADEPAVVHDYAGIWRHADKIVFSTTLAEVRTARTRLEHDFHPDVIRRLIDDSPGDVSIGGATLAAHAVRAGLIAEYWVLLNPVVVGGGTPWLPPGVKVGLSLREERRFANGVVFLRYAAQTTS
jgi:dihydrofolate reductase